MNTWKRGAVSLGLAAALLGTTTLADTPDPGMVDFGKFAPGKGVDFVEVNIRPNIIAMAAQLAAKAEPKVAEVLNGLKGVRVNIIGLNDENRAATEERVQSIRADLESKGWERLATVQKDGNQVGVYVKTRADAVEGIVVTVIQGTEHAVLVNVVGDIKPDKLVLLGERFNIEPLKEAGLALKK